MPHGPDTMPRVKMIAFLHRYNLFWKEKQAINFSFLSSMYQYFKGLVTHKKMLAILLLYSLVYA